MLADMLIENREANLTVTTPKIISLWLDHNNARVERHTYDHEREELALAWYDKNLKAVLSREMVLKMPRTRVRTPVKDAIESSIEFFTSKD